MLDDSLVIAVDTLNTGTTTDTTYSKYEEQINRSVYIADSHEPGKRDLLTVYRSLPKPVGVFKGVRKSAVKFTVDYEVDDSAGGIIDCPAIVEISFSLPIGVSAGAILTLRQRAVALLDQDGIMDKINVLQMV